MPLHLAARACQALGPADSDRIARAREHHGDQGDSPMKIGTTPPSVVTVMSPPDSRTATTSAVTARSSHQDSGNVRGHHDDPGREPPSRGAAHTWLEEVDHTWQRSASAR